MGAKRPESLVMLCDSWQSLWVIIKISWKRKDINCINKNTYRKHMVRKVGWAQTCPPPLPSWADPLLLLSDLLSGPIQLHHAPTGKTGIKSSFFKKLKKTLKIQVQVKVRLKIQIQVKVRLKYKYKWKCIKRLCMQ